MSDYLVQDNKKLLVKVSGTEANHHPAGSLRSLTKSPVELGHPDPHPGMFH